MAPRYPIRGAILDLNIEEMSVCLCDFDWSLFANVIGGLGGLLAGVFTIMLYFLAKRELNKNNSIAEVDLYYKLKSELLNPDAIRLHKEIVDGLYRFDSAREVFLRKEEIVSVYDVGYNYLGHIEDASTFIDEGIVSYKKISDGFGAMILDLGNDQAIRDFVAHSRIAYKDVTNVNWAGFEKLYLKIRSDLPEEQKPFYKEEFPKYKPTPSPG